MRKFPGFTDEELTRVPIPSVFFTDVLPFIRDVGELKLTLYFFWRLEQMEGPFRFLDRAGFQEDAQFLQGLAGDPQAASQALEAALALVVQRGVILQAALERGGEETTYYFLNSPRGRAAVKAIQAGSWRPSIEPPPLDLSLEKPNIFQLYEDHIGALTPMLAEALRDAEDTYPARWIEEAFRIAVEYNKRNWRYIEAILKRWQKEKRDEGNDRRDSEKTRRRYVEGEFSDFIDH